MAHPTTKIKRTLADKLKTTIPEAMKVMKKGLRSWNREMDPEVKNRGRHKVIPPLTKREKSPMGVY